MALATLGIISIGDMGLGIARLAIANNYKVITNASDRSQATQDRAKRNFVQLVDTDVDLCNKADYVLSIVPPRNAIATAQRIAKAAMKPDFKARSNPLYFLDLNAISPKSSREIDSLFTQSSQIRFIDGGIIGGPPNLKDDGTWSKPSIPLSGPHSLSSAQPSGEHLAQILNMRHINNTIGSATGLKMCFASLSKGFAALAIQSFTTAQNLGVLDELRTHLDEYAPGNRARAEKGLTGMPPKAYRWVAEMEEIAATFEADGGFNADESIFRSIARVYDFVANGTELGKETMENRSRGTTADDVARLMAEGAERRKVKTD
ncbi:hypothetical protein M409DRAFT_17057 [Zasmidium cellare ATCC 36951]|uniref:Phosphogluconate dehydrogenase NAD-binding putative C-terminal domain-containing protein n=1 Tax=Zasmidium cellare ATCC 36951 TaxID=1080233 RepID=A0A6A6D3S7_ZASCE|nr:uncharacterized protein M409DRAFT_17057 [Zasmidium cellare ATCC 36951]KAF2173108.1 hypothetical protein M409DRAFT_17057 [Zasmidium cellare ATCC 36951]